MAMMRGASVSQEVEARTKWLFRAAFGLSALLHVALVILSPTTPHLVSAPELVVMSIVVTPKKAPQMISPSVPIPKVEPIVVPEKRVTRQKRVEKVPEVAPVAKVDTPRAPEPAPVVSAPEPARIAEPPPLAQKILTTDSPAAAWAVSSRVGSPNGSSTGRGSGSAVGGNGRSRSNTAGGGRTAQAVATLRTEPEYPEYAREAGIEGWVRVRFSVNSHGGVQNAVVVEAQPPRVFDRVALDAIRKWKYQPGLANGRPIDQHGITIRLTFRLDT